MLLAIAHEQTRLQLCLADLHTLWVSVLWVSFSFRKELWHKLADSDCWNVGHSADLAQMISIIVWPSQNIGTTVMLNPLQERIYKAHSNCK